MSVELLNACYFAHTDRALELVASGDFNPSYVNEDNGQTTLMMVCNYGMSKVALALIATGKSNPSYVSAHNGETALMYACMHKMSKVAIALLETGESNPGHINNYNMTALMLACHYEMYDVVDVLVNKLNFEELLREYGMINQKYGFKTQTMRPCISIWNALMNKYNNIFVIDI